MTLEHLKFSIFIKVLSIQLMEKYTIVVFHCTAILFLHWFKGE